MEILFGIGFAAIFIVMLCEGRWLDADPQKARINSMADRSRKQRPERQCRYAQAGWREGR